MPIQKRPEMIEKENSKLSIIEQCELLEISRSGYYYEPSPENLEILNFLDHQYLETPFYGSRKLAIILKQKGYKINRKRLKRLMGILYPEPLPSIQPPISILIY